VGDEPDEASARTPGYRMNGDDPVVGVNQATLFAAQRVPRPATWRFPSIVDGQPGCSRILLTVWCRRDFQPFTTKLNLRSLPQPFQTSRGLPGDNTE
jgi:hypothetical protein